MRSKLRAFLAIGAVSAALTACSDQPTSAPVVPRVAGVNADVQLPACNFTTLREAVRAYADVSGNDEIFGYIRDMSGDAYGQGMNGLARLAQIRANGPKKAGATAVEGGAAVTAFLACMPVGTVQDGFATSIVSAMGAGGMFEVPPTTSTPTNAIYSRGETGPYFWAAKPDDGNTWGFLSNNKRYVVFGYEINGGTGFNYNVIPQLGQEGMPAVFAGSLVLGACGTFTNAIRVNHDGEILFDEDMVAICGTPAPPLASLPSGLGGDLASLVRKSLSVFAPQRAFAFGGGVGGAVSELSPTSLPTVAPRIAFKPQPATNKSVGDQLGIKIWAYTIPAPGDTVPLKNAEVTLTVTGNSGLAALLYNPATQTSCFQVTRPTNASGIADFSDIGVAKSGGYTLTAAAIFDGLSANAVVSNLFNVKNKKITTTASCPL